MSNFEEFKEEWLKDKEVKEYYDELQPDYAIIQALIDARVKKKTTQKDILRRVEEGRINLSLDTLKRLAECMGTRLKIEFIPIKK